MTQTAQPSPAAPPDDVVPGGEIYTPEFRADPYPVYTRLRAERPVVKVRTPRFDSFLVTRYEDARQALSDPRLSKDLYRAGDTYLAVFGEKARQINTNMLNSDPPEHTRLRRLVTQAFTPKRIEAMRPRVEQIVEGLLDRVPGDRRGHRAVRDAVPQLLGEPVALRGQGVLPLAARGRRARRP